jgi:hypothetical protein
MPRLKQYLMDLDFRPVNECAIMTNCTLRFSIILLLTVKTYFSSFEVFAAVKAKALLLNNGQSYPEDDRTKG